MKSTLALIILAVAMSCQAATTGAWAQAASNDALTKAEGAQRDEGLRSQILAARQAVQREDWPNALLTWQDLARRRVDAAPAQLCQLYFDARQGSFEPAKTTDWCRRAAGAGDADGLYLIGLLYLAGLGVPQNITQAHAFCAAALLRDEKVPAKFCLAAVAVEQAHANRATLAEMRNRTAGATAVGSATDAGGATSSRDRCDTAFAAIGASFDAKDVVKWCGAAAAGDDPEALKRMGLLALFGLGGAKDLVVAARDCADANRLGQGHVSAAFCLAAAAEQRRALAVAAQQPGIAFDQTTGRALPSSLPDPFAGDRTLDQPRRTAAGLDYTCRKMSDWARFEAPGLTILTPRDKLFGKAILDYGTPDFDQLDRAARSCADVVALTPGGDQVAHDLGNFRSSLAALKVRQGSLKGESRQAAADLAQLARDQQFLARVQKSQMSEVSIDASFATPQEEACVEEIRRDVTGSLLGEQTTLEIRNSNRSEANGSFVVHGEERLKQAAGDFQQARDFSPFSCTFIGHTEKIASSVLSTPPSGFNDPPSTGSKGAP